MTQKIADQSATVAGPERESISWQVILVPTGLCLLVILILLFLPALFSWPPNNPYLSGEAAENVLLSNFDEPPKNLDPAISYWVDEATFLGSILETPFQYHYLKRPQEMIPGSIARIPQAVYLDKDDKVLPADTPDDNIARVMYEFEVRPGMRYQPHPCFAKEGDKFLYHNLAKDDISLDGIRDVNDPFFKTGSREVLADDFLFQIRRMGDPRLSQPSPQTDLLMAYIEGYEEFVKQAKQDYDAAEQAEKSKAGGINIRSRYHRVLIPLDLNQYPIPGLVKVDDHRYRIYLKKRYPQILYWMAMFFYAPTPWEAQTFYNQEACVENGLSFKRFPVGSGPFYITKYDDKSEIRLARNPNFLQWQTYPSEGDDSDREAGLLNDSGKKLPFLDGMRYLVENEGLPIWNKFLQGYYDSAGISSDTFDQVIKIDPSGFNLTDEFAGRNIQLVKAPTPTVYYFGFNMRDPVVGHATAEKFPDPAAREAEEERRRKLRRAIAIAMDFKEYIQIFANGRGIVANGPLPPDMFGYKAGREGMNPYTQTWDEKIGQAVPRSLEDAKQLLAEAGYPNGIDTKTQKQLTLTYNNTMVSAQDRALALWYQKQFQKIGILLISESTDNAAFDEKMHKGTVQCITMGWHADYPDPENFLFLLLAEGSIVDTGGENRCNYANPEFDALFQKMKIIDNTPKRQEIIDQMVDLVRRDGPWVFQFHPQSYYLSHGWVHNNKPQPIGYNSMKYYRIDSQQRSQAQLDWNSPQYQWPLLVLALVFVPISLYPLLRRRPSRATQPPGAARTGQE